MPAFTELLLCVVDLPPGFPAASKTDPAYDGGCSGPVVAHVVSRGREPRLLTPTRCHSHPADPASGYVTQAEHDRLAAALAAATTTEAEDQVLLDSSVYAGMCRAATGGP